MKAFLLLTKYGSEAAGQRRRLQNNGSCSSSNSKKRKHKCEIPTFKPSPKAESVEVLDKGLTNNIFTISSLFNQL